LSVSPAHVRACPEPAPFHPQNFLFACGRLSGCPPSNTWFFETNSSQRSERHHGRFSRFCGAHGRDRQTDRQTTLYSVCSNRPQPADVAMRPNVQLPTTLVVQVEQSVCVCVCPYLCVRVTITFELTTGTHYVRPVCTDAFLTPVRTARTYGCQKCTGIYTGRIYG